MIDKEAFINHRKTKQGPKAHIPIKVMLNLFRNRIFDHTDQDFHDTRIGKPSQEQILDKPRNDKEREYDFGIHDRCSQKPS